MKVEIGKNTLGGGKKMTTELSNYNRSTHDLSYIFRTTMAVGVLVPSCKILMEPGDTFTIKNRCHTMTHPTVGPLFGSFKQQNDFFFVPIRLYNAMLHNNTLNVGLDMAKVKLPKFKWDATTWEEGYIAGTDDTIYNQVNPSCLLAYLGNRTLMSLNPSGNIHYHNAVPVLGYFDILKNYYANKQEEYFYTVNGQGFVEVMQAKNEEGYLPTLILNAGSQKSLIGSTMGNSNAGLNTNLSSLTGNTLNPAIIINKPLIDTNQCTISITLQQTGATVAEINGTIGSLIAEGKLTKITDPTTVVDYTTNINDQGEGELYQINQTIEPNSGIWAVKVNNVTFIGGLYNKYPLTDIDDERERILASGRNQYYVQADYINDIIAMSNGVPASANPMQGLALKTYQSDINNNWVRTEWIDGDNGINAITAIDTSSGEFTIDQFNLASKVYKMLNRIAVSDGSYNAWIQTVFTAGGLNHVETPIYIGGSSLEVEFQEVINNSGTSEEPLGTLAGRGIATNKKGGNIKFKADEPGYIICITSLTPRVDYYQGNDWDTQLDTLDDLHKPALDGIGFQDRLFYFLNSSIDNESAKMSIGKQPAWIEYMTNVNKTYGNFAIEQNEGWMCLNRKYEGTDSYTTYVQPHLYNNIFADTSVTGQNFWVQIGFDIEARRVMSAKQIPNL